MCLQFLAAKKRDAEADTSALEQELAFWRERSRHVLQRQEALKAHTSQAAG